MRDQNEYISKVRAVYDRLIQGQSQSKVCERLKLPKSTVNEITSLLLKAGYIECSTPGAKPLFYQATKKLFMAREIIVLESTRRSRSPEEKRYNIIQIQKGAFRARFLRPPAYPIPWRKTWTASKVQGFTFSAYIPEAGGEVVFIRLIGPKGGDILRIFLPRMNFTKDEANYQTVFRWEKAKEARAWFQHKYKCYLGDLIMGQIPDFAMAITETRVIKAAQQGTYRIGELTLDMSRPHGLAELESKNIDDVMQYAALPDRLNATEIEVSELKAKIARLEALLELKILQINRKKPDDFVEVT